MVLKLIFSIAIVFKNFAYYESAFEGYRVYEVPLLPAKITVDNFYKFFNNPSTKDIEVIHINPFKGSIQVLVSPSKRKEFLATLKKKKLKSKVIIKDVGRLLKSSYQPRMDDADVNFENVGVHYLNYEEIKEFIELISQSFPDKVKVENIGSSVEGEQIPMIIITDEIDKMENKAVIFVEAGIHSREWVSVSTAVYFIDRLAGTPDYTKHVEWRIIPVANPDGYKYTFENQSNRFWRKNRRTFPDTACEGVDLNRNFDFHWGTEGSDFNKCSESYVGEGPFSEPESRAISDAILEIQNRIKVFVSFHSYGQYILHPPSISSVHIPDEEREKLEDIGIKMSIAIYKEYRKRYLVGTPAVIMYEAPGSSMDWSMFNAFVQLSFAFELRDKGQFGYILPENQILPTAEEIWEAVIVLYEEIRGSEISNAVGIEARHQNISDDGLQPETKKAEKSSRLSNDSKLSPISGDGLHPDTNDANKISIPFTFIQSVLASLLNDWLSYLWDNDVNKLFDNFFIDNDVD